MVNTPHAGTPIAGASPPGPAWFRFFADLGRVLNTELSGIAGLSPSDDDVLQRKSGAWTNRTIAQLLADLAAPGTTFQPLDADLTAIAALTTTSFGRALLELADAAAGRDALDIETGSYTPTITLVQNLDSATAQSCQYIRVGPIVAVGLAAVFDATASGSLAIARASLPIASAFTAGSDASGGGGCIPDSVLYIDADATNDQVRLLCIPTTTGGANMRGTFIYIIR